MTRIIAILLACVPLCGCAGSIVGDAIAGPERLAQADDSYCQSIGLQLGTTDYANCRERQTARRGAHHAMGAAMIVRGAEIAGGR